MLFGKKRLKHAREAGEHPSVVRLNWPGHLGGQMVKTGMNDAFSG